MVQTSRLITLKTDNSELVISPEIGGAIIAFNYQNQSVFRSVDESSFAFFSNVRLSGCYPLIPFSNRIADGVFKWEGIEYELKKNFIPSPHAIHGNGWQRAWTVQSVSSYNNEINVTLSLNHQFENTGDWPFAFNAIQNFKLIGNQLVLTLTIQNVDDRNMPCGLGWHPFFKRTPQMAVDIDVDSMWENNENMLPSKQIQLNKQEVDALFLPLGQAPAPNVDNCFTGVVNPIKIIQPEFKRFIQITVDAELTHTVIFTPAHGEFIAIEPVTHRNAALNEATPLTYGIKSLAPNESFTTSCTFAVEPIT